MKHMVLVALRNAEGQLLMFENSKGLCSLPGCPREETQSPFVVIGRYLNSLGLVVGGITPLRETFQVDDYLVQGLAAYWISGKVAPGMDIRSVSWIAPTVALKMDALTQASKSFVVPSLWTGGVSPG